MVAGSADAPLLPRSPQRVEKAGEGQCQFSAGQDRNLGVLVRWNASREIGQVHVHEEDVSVHDALHYVNTSIFMCACVWAGICTQLSLISDWNITSWQHIFSRYTFLPSMCSTYSHVLHY